MGLCDNPDKQRGKHFRKLKTSTGSGKQSGHRYRGKPKMVYREGDWVTNPAKLGFTLGPGPRPVLFKTEELWDTHGYLQLENPCAHEKFELGSDPSEIRSIADSEGVIVDFNTSFLSPRDMIRGNMPCFTCTQLDELAFKSRDRITQVLPTETSIANFIIELIQMLEGNIFKIRKFSQIWVHAMQAYKRELERLLKNGTKYASAKWLAWNFAIKPALKDLKNILCSISEAYKRMKWMQDHNHKYLRKHYARTGLQKIMDNDQWDPVAGKTFQQQLAFVKGIVPTTEGVNGPYFLEVHMDYLTIDYVANSNLFLEIPDRFLDGSYGIGILWGALMGLHNPVGILWEATPWSWLIDYFLGVRNRLFETMYDYNPYNEGVRVIGMSHSYKIKAAGSARIINTAHSFTHQELGNWVYDLYLRTPDLPFCEQSERFRVPSDWYHHSILVAIAGQRRH